MTVQELPLLCSSDEVERLISSYGMLAFSDHDEDGEQDEGVVEDCIRRASDEIHMHLHNRYDPAVLAEVSLVRRWATIGAACYLCQTRNNPPPESLGAQWEGLITDPDGTIPKIGRGVVRLPGVEQRYDSRPSFSNLQVDRRYPTAKTRVTLVNSSDAPTELSQHPARESFYDH